MTDLTLTPVSHGTKTYLMLSDEEVNTALRWYSNLRIKERTAQSIALAEKMLRKRDKARSADKPVLPTQEYTMVNLVWLDGEKHDAYIREGVWYYADGSGTRVLDIDNVYTFTTLSTPPQEAAGEAKKPEKALPTKPGIYTCAAGTSQDYMGEWHTDGIEIHYLNTSGNWIDVGWGQPYKDDGPFTRFVAVED